MADKLYPRPDFERKNWLSLDGIWDFEFDNDDIGLKEEWHKKKLLKKKIKVPYCIESKESGIAIKNPCPIFWYAKDFPRSKFPAGKRFFLNFGAVDYEAEVWLNGSHLGAHKGGYTPFSFDITDLLHDENHLTLRVKDYRSKNTIRGKQLVREKLSEIFYTPVSGIWQSVYIYSTGNSCIKNIRIDADLDTITLNSNIECKEKHFLNIEVIDPEKKVIINEKIIINNGANQISYPIENPIRWSVDNPNLYTIQLTLLNEDNTVSDKVSSYAGLRKIEANDGKIFLNETPIYLKMLLVQGYYPGGHYTPVEIEEFFENDIKIFKQMGFNGIRIHQKIEDPRFLYFCDKHGLIVWEEMPSPYMFGKIDEAQYEEELFSVLNRDSNHPSIIAIVLFNETWGINNLLWNKKRREYLKELFHRVKEYAPDKLVIDNSGFDHILTDIIDIHHYLISAKKIRKLYNILGNPRKMTLKFCKIFQSVIYALWTHRFAKKPFIKGGNYRGFEPFLLSEFGGAGYYKTNMGILDSFKFNVDILAAYKNIVGYCFTQAYDVEKEQNGLLNFDRSPKFSIEEIKSINAIISINNLT